METFKNIKRIINTGPAVTKKSSPKNCKNNLKPNIKVKQKRHGKLLKSIYFMLLPISNIFVCLILYPQCYWFLFNATKSVLQDRAYF